MFTITTVPLPFRDSDRIRQLNAIKSWSLLDPQPHVLLQGPDVGTQIFMKIGDWFRDGNLEHISRIDTNPLGDLSMGSVFKNADLYGHDVIAYIDTDVILLPVFSQIVEYVVQQAWDKFLICSGRQWSDINWPLDFSTPDWVPFVKSRITKIGQKGSDIAVYPRGLFEGMPDFSIGRGWWDGWRMGRALQLGAEMINVERIPCAIHQKHGHRWSGHPGTGRNRRLMGNCEAWIKDSTVILDKIPERGNNAES